MWEKPSRDDRIRFLLDLTFEAFSERLRSWGYKAIHAKDVFGAIHRRGVQHIAELDGCRIPKALKARLLAEETHLPLTVFKKVQDFPSQDGSVKYVYTLTCGEKIESVYLPFPRRATFCVSSQVGCALGCAFCATGAMGFKRQLRPAEMLGQIYHLLHVHRQREAGMSKRFSVVFMGMGEPLHNLKNLMTTFRILTHAHGLVLSSHDIALSTSGLVPQIEALALYESRPRLMVSIAATQDEMRSRIMPVNRAYPLARLLACLEEFPLKRKERIMLAYVVMADVNDSDEDAHRLAGMSRRFPSMVNLIPMNAHQQSPGLREPREDRLQTFYRTLMDLGVFTTIRRSRGRDIAGACGQLQTRV